MGQGRSRIDQKWESSTLRGIPAKSFGILLAEGVTEWGPADATPVTSFDDFRGKFGRFLQSYDLALQVWLYFKHGGTKAYIKRLFHYADHTPTGSGVPATATRGLVVLSTGAGPYGVQATLTVDGLYYGALALRVQVAAASNGKASYFDLKVYHPEYTKPIEHIRNLTMDTTSIDYAVDVVNTSVRRSAYVTLTDMTASGTTEERRPATQLSPVSLIGGNDGLTALDNDDYIGGTTFRTGLYGFNLVDEGNFLIVPDNTAVAVQNAAIAYCEDIKQEKVVFIPDVPASLTSASANNQADALTESRAKTGLDWPRIRITNPDKVVYGQNTQTLVVGLSGIKAGISCGLGQSSQNNETKMWTSPSNEIFGWIEDAVGLEGADSKHEVLDLAIQDLVTDHGINPVVVGTRGTDGRYGVWFNDCQTGENLSNVELASIGNQCGLSHLRYLYEAYLQRHRTQGNTETRRLTIETAIKSNLQFWCSLGCFATKDAGSAFHVNVDVEGRNLNNPIVQKQQKLKIKIGIAFADPSRFIELIFTRDNRAVESYMQQAAASTGNAAT